MREREGGWERGEGESGWFLDFGLIMQVMHAIHYIRSR